MDKKVMEAIKKFTKDRNWEQFHSGANLAKSISIEAAELLEVFQWSSQEESVDKVKEELADVLIYCIDMAMHYNLDIDKIIMDKIQVNEKKYPIEKAYGNSKKYNKK